MSAFPVFGSKIPFSEPQWYTGFKTPYYKQTHVDFRAKVREWAEKALQPYTDEWEEAQDYPRSLHEDAYKAGVYGAIWPKEYGGTPPEDFDMFHELIYWDELARCGSGGVLAACFLTVKIALPPILHMGSKAMKAKVCPDIISGKKIIALAITEPEAGSDVSNIGTTARRFEPEAESYVSNIGTTARREGDFYIVNGQKKFITSGMKADYFTTAVRTSGPGMGGISLLLIDSKTPGIKLRKLKTQGWLSSNTAHILFEDVKVPVSSLIGQENQGFMAIMLNFNHERFVGIAMANRGARNCIEDSISYARVRQTFGKKLIENQTIVHKISEMATRVESIHLGLENVAFQMNQNVDPRKIGGAIALLKVQATKTLEYCAREASQILGGNSYLRSGPGSRVERIYREVRVAAIGGGSEEVMTDLAMRQARL